MTQALIIVDLQRGVLSDEGTWDPDGVVTRAQELAQRARAAGVPVIWVQHASSEMPRDSEGWALADGLQPDPGEAIIHKRFGDSFEETELEEELGDADHLVICGAQSDFCIRSTVHGALVRGFDVTLVGDTHTCGEIPAQYTGNELLRAQTKINVMNMAIAYGATYPGRQGRVADAAEIQFATP